MPGLLRRACAGLGLATLAALASGIAKGAGPEPRAPEHIYASSCGYCHGHDVGPIIRGRALSPQLIEFMVRNGNGAMPAFRPTEITPAELAALAEWISRSEADPKEHGR
jgi:mono/diheme cytochrome c family protein